MEAKPLMMMHDGKFVAEMKLEAALITTKVRTDLYALTNHRLTLKFDFLAGNLSRGKNVKEIRVVVRDKNWSVQTILSNVDDDSSRDVECFFEVGLQGEGDGGDKDSMGIFS